MSYDQQYRMPLPEPKTVSGLGIAGLVLGICSITGCWVPFFNIFAVLLGMLGLLLAAIGLLVALLGKQSGTGMPLAACVTCGVGITLGVLFASAYFSALADFLTECRNFHPTLDGMKTGDSTTEDGTSETVDATQTAQSTGVPAIAIGDATTSEMTDGDTESGGDRQEQARRARCTRTWKSKSGFTLEAELIAYVNGMLHLKKLTGETIEVPLEEMAPESQTTLRDLLDAGDVPQELPTQ